LKGSGIVQISVHVPALVSVHVILSHEKSDEHLDQQDQWPDVKWQVKLPEPLHAPQQQYTKKHMDQ
jgi:hypothetical protein